MSFKQLISQRLKGEPRGELTVNRGVNSEVNLEAEKFTRKVTRIDEKEPFHCAGCQHYDTGPAPDGKSLIFWCGPWRHANGDLHFFNIQELKVCPLTLRAEKQKLAA